ncbi:WecB/TagA/CpsF family glycosyltransferase [Vibrio alfacsensis]|uniref:WecB/TagA/CpsF family glycosyltransferase n=1 Tax=Vibrio alfacsensis TaxID=1074311 RepID=UPI004067625C
MVNKILNKISHFDQSNIETFTSYLLSTNKPISIGFVNQHGVNLMLCDNLTYENFMSLDFLLRDGIGVKLACHINGIRPNLNLNGTDFIPKLVRDIYDSKRKVKYFVFGTSEPWLSKGAERLIPNNQVYLKNGFLDDDSYLEYYAKNVDVNCLNVVVLAMGMPKQERIASTLIKLDVPSLIICGGAIIDFHAGRTSRAPYFLRKFGFEWLYRLIQEPKRMFNRYVIGIPKFFLHVLLKKS